MKTKTFFPARLTLRENVGVFYLAKCRFDPRCYLFYPARLTLREKLSGSLSRPVFLREKLGLFDWLIAFPLTTLSLSYPARLTLREKIIQGFLPGPSYFAGKTRVVSANGRFTFLTLSRKFCTLPVLLCGKNFRVFFPARLTLRENAGYLG